MTPPAGRSSRARGLPRAGFLAALVLLAAWGAAGCGRSPARARTDLPPADQMVLGARAVQEGDYYGAEALLKGYLEREPSGEKADEAHYLLGLCYMRTKEWPSAATEFVIVQNQFGDSPRVPDARYHLGVAYWRESRGSPYDQDYTRRAITEFDRFLELFPDHPRADEIRGLRRQALDRLARKDFENGRLYLKMSHPEPARFYFQDLQRKYPDTVWASRAALCEAQTWMKQKKWEAAAAVLDRLLAGSPAPDVARAAQRLQEEVRRQAAPAPAK